jgi:hypothetical protein
MNRWICKRPAFSPGQIAWWAAYGPELHVVAREIAQCFFRECFEIRFRLYWFSFSATFRHEHLHCTQRSAVQGFARIVPFANQTFVVFVSFVVN